MGNCNGKSKQKKPVNQNPDKMTQQNTIMKSDQIISNIDNDKQIEKQKSQNNTPKVTDNNNTKINQLQQQNNEQNNETNFNNTPQNDKENNNTTTPGITQIQNQDNLKENNKQNDVKNNDQQIDKVIKEQEQFIEQLKDDQHINENDKLMINSFIDKSVNKTLFDKTVLQEEQKNIDQNGDGYFNESQMLFYGEKLQKEKQKQLKKKKKNPKGEITIRWKEGKPIGAGSFGKVVEGMNQDTGEIMAVKQISRKDIPCQNEEQKKEMLDALKLEIELLKDLQHKNIVKYIGVTQNNETETLNIFLEYVALGSINTVIEKYGKTNEVTARNYMQNILEGLEYLHSHNIVHRDIKGANILVDSFGTCKLADFGSSKRLVNNQHDTNKLEQIKGTVNWMAPEVIRQKQVGRFSDIWSLGCTLLEMLTGTIPFNQYTNVYTAMYNIGQGTCKPEIPNDLSADVKDFLNKCFEIEPQKRPNVCQLLKHPFMLSPQNKRISQQLQLTDCKQKRLSGSDQGKDLQDNKQKKILMSRQSFNQQVRDKQRSSKNSHNGQRNSNSKLIIPDLQKSPQQHANQVKKENIPILNGFTLTTPPQKYNNNEEINNKLNVNENNTKINYVINNKNSNNNQTDENKRFSVTVQEVSQQQ